jgi:hypothetical protein
MMGKWDRFRSGIWPVKTAAGRIADLLALGVPIPPPYARKIDAKRQSLYSRRPDLADYSIVLLLLYSSPANLVTQSNDKHRTTSHKPLIYNLSITAQKRKETSHFEASIVIFCI